MSGRRLVLVFSGSYGRSPQTWFVGGSLAVHCAIAAVLLVAPSLRRSAVLPLDVPVVQLAGSVPAARPPAPAPLPAPAPAVPAPREPVKTPQPKIQKVPPPEPVRKEKKPAPSPKLDPPPPAAEPQPPGPSGAQTPAPPAAPGAGGITALDTGDTEFAWYRASLIAALRSRWTRPVIEDAQDTIAATVAFEIRRDGSVTDVRVETPSGVSVMDRSVLRAVIEASPLPPLPSTWREPTLSARFEFRWRPGEPD